VLNLEIEKIFARYLKPLLMTSSLLIYAVSIIGLAAFALSLWEVIKNSRMEEMKPREHNSMLTARMTKTMMIDARKEAKAIDVVRNGPYHPGEQEQKRTPFLGYLIAR
jgi:hypothetical protein